MKRILSLVAVLLALIVGVAYSPPAHAEPSKIIIGLTGMLVDPNIVQAGFIATGWVGPNDRYIQFLYDNGPGSEQTAVEEAAPRLLDLVNQVCFQGIPCELDGISRGGDVLVYAENLYGWPAPGLDVNLHETPATVTGAWRSVAVDNPALKTIIDLSGIPFLSIPLPTPGTNVYLSNEDFWANVAPQCQDWVAIAAQAATYSFVHIPQFKALPHATWIGPDGAQYNEYGGHIYASGNDPVKPTCPDGQWWRTPAP